MYKMTKNNEKKIQSMQAFLSEIKEEVFSVGFYGKAAINFTVEDGNIQEYETHIIHKHK